MQNVRLPKEVRMHRTGCIEPGERVPAQLGGGGKVVVRATAARVVVTKAVAIGAASMGVVRAGRNRTRC